MHWSMLTFNSSIVDFSSSFSFINFAISSALACKHDQQDMNEREREYIIKSGK